MTRTTRDAACDDALRVLRCLRDGIDPKTSAVLDDGHVCQRAEVVRALFVAVEALERRGADSGAAARPLFASAADDAAESGAERPKRPRPERSGQPWSAADDTRLVEAFDGGADERELAASFGRSRTSIRARLARHGRGDLLGEGPRPRYPVLDGRIDVDLGSDPGVNERAEPEASLAETAEVAGR